MVRTVKIARKGETSVASAGKDSARLVILPCGTSSFTPLKAKSAGNQDEDAGANFEELPSMSDVVKRRGGVQGKAVAQNERCNEDEETDSASAEDEEEGDEEEGKIHDEQSILDREDQDSGDVQEQLGGDFGESQDEQHDSESQPESDEQSCSVDEPSPTATQRGSSKGQRVTIDWNEPEDTRKLLEKLEEFAMRDHYVGRKNGTWRNNVFGEVSKMLGKPGKTCSNRYMRLRHKYLGIMKVLGLGFGLIWDAKSSEIRGPEKLWKQVVDADLVKLKGQKFLFKEEFDNLNGLLNLAPPPKATASCEQLAPTRPMTVLQSRLESDGRGTEDSPPNVDDNGHDEGAEDGECEGQNSGDEYAQSDAELTKSPLPPLNTRRRAQMAETSARERSDRRWFDIASIHELVRLLLEYVQDDYYISPISKTWKNGVFKEIAVKIGRDQKRCQWKYMSLRHAYMEIEKLLSSNFGFEWDPERHEVVGSNEAWACVKGTHLTRHRRSKFLFRDEFAKLAEKLSFEWREDAYQNRKRDRKRERTSARTAGSRSSYAEPPDEIEQSADGEDQDDGDTIGHASTPPSKKRLFSETRENHGPDVEDHHDQSVGMEEAHEPLRKRRLLSDTYEKRREAFYVAATNVSFRREELKGMVKAQLAIQHQQVAIHKEQIAALHAQLTVEAKLSKSLENCHLKDTLRRDTLEGLRSTAHSRLQDERCLTPLGKLTIMRTLHDLRSKAEGYFGVMYLDPVIRNLWLNVELERLATGEKSEYFIDKRISKSHKAETTETLDEDSGFTLVDDDFKLESNAIDAAKGACENDDNGVGVHFNGDGCSSDPVKADHATRDKGVRVEQLVGNDEQGTEGSPFEIDPYIFLEKRQGKDVVI